MQYRTWSGVHPFELGPAEAGTVVEDMMLVGGTVVRCPSLEVRSCDCAW
jgi:hypothetical protein